MAELGEVRYAIRAAVREAMQLQKGAAGNPLAQAQAVEYAEQLILPAVERAIAGTAR